MSNATKAKNKSLVQQGSTERWGISISNTKIEGVIIDTSQSQKALCRLQLPVEFFHTYDHLRGYDHILSQVQLLIAQLERASEKNRPEKIGISTPGVINPSTGILENSNILCLNGHPIGSDLSALLHMHVLLANDANCFTLAEATLGAARDYKVVMGVVLETGVGAGIVVNHYLVEGLHGIAGEWGHNTMRGQKALCRCGKKGCSEMVFSEPAVQHFYEKKTGQEVSLSEIVKRAEAGESSAVKTLEHLQKNFAKAIAVPINVLDPEVIVMGGRVSAIDLLYTKATRDKILRYIFNKEFKTKFLKPALGDSACAFGAAMLSSKPQD